MKSGRGAVIHLEASYIMNERFQHLAWLYLVLLVVLAKKGGVFHF